LRFSAVKFCHKDSFDLILLYFTGMSLRRDFTKYLGGAAVGTMLGFYVGIQDLLGLRSSDPKPSPQPEPTPESDTSEESEQSPESEPQEGQGVLIEDDFESNHGMDTYQFQTGQSDDYDWGTTQTNVPGDGSYVGWVYENYSGQRTVAIANSNETVDWDTTHEFNFMIRCTEYSKNTPWNSVDISWRGGIISEEGDGKEEETTLRLSVFSTDSSEDPRPFQWRGKGVVDAGEGYNIEWATSTWYNIQGYVDQENGVAEAKIWKNSDPEPEDYQISATVSTESATDLPYSIKVDGRTGSPIRCEIAHLKWTEFQ
jgi:hypothetical protein